MTVPATNRRSPVYAGNGVTTAFPFTFKVFATTDIQVRVTAASGTITTAVAGSDYSVVLNADQSTSPGGTVTYPLSGSPLPTGASLVIIGALPYDQTLSLPGGGNFNPVALENALDRIEIQVQQIAEIGQRAIRAPAGETLSELPAAAVRANRLSGFDSLGNVIGVLPTGGDASALALDLANSAVAVKGAGQVGYNYALVYGPSTVGKKLRELVSVLDFGADNTGAVDSYAAFVSAWAVIAAGGGVLYVPPGTYLLNSLLTLTAHASQRCAILAYGAELTTGAGVTAGLRVTGGATTGGITIFGLQINHRGNAVAAAGFELFATWNARLQDCSVEAHGTAAGYASYLLRQGAAADTATGCFWTALDNCHNRRRASGDGTQVACAVRVRGACNNTVIRGGNLGDAVTCVHHTYEAGQTYIANSLRVEGSSFEGYTTAYHCDGTAGADTADGTVIAHNRFEAGTTVFSFTGSTVDSATPPFIGANYLVSNAGTYLNNPNNRYVSTFDFSITPNLNVGPTLIGSDGLRVRSTDVAVPAFEAQIVNIGEGIALSLNGQNLWKCRYAASGKVQVEGNLGAGVSMYHAAVGGISATATRAENLRGSVTFTGAATKAVTFVTAEPNTTYYIAISGGANETFWVTAKGTGGFTLNSSNAASTAVVDWVLIR